MRAADDWWRNLVPDIRLPIDCPRQRALLATFCTCAPASWLSSICCTLPGARRRAHYVLRLRLDSNEKESSDLQDAFWLFSAHHTTFCPISKSDCVSSGKLATLAYTPGSSWVVVKTMLAHKGPVRSSERFWQRALLSPPPRTYGMVYAGAISLEVAGSGGG